MRSKENPSVRKAVELTTRREVLRRGAAVAAVSAITPFWTRLARAQATTAFDYYISPTGSDSNQGTLASPWSLNALNSKGSVYAGKRVGIIGDQGTYDCLSIYIAANGGSTLGSTNTSGANQAAFAIAGGTSSSPTYVASCNSSGVYVPRLAVLDGGSTSLSQSASVNPGGNALLGNLGSGCQYITLDGVTFQNNYYKYAYFGYEASVSPSNLSPGVTVQNCHFGGSGKLYNQISQENPNYLTLYACQGAIIQNNLMDGAVDDSTSRFNGFMQWASTDTLFQYNSVILTSAGCGYLYVKNINNKRATIRYNYLYKSSTGEMNEDGWDLSGNSSDTSYLYNNVIVADNQNWSTNGEAMNPAASPENQVIHNNTFVALDGSWAYWGIECESAAGAVTHYNNIYYRTGGASGTRGDANFNANGLALTDYNLYPSSPRIGLNPDGTQSLPTIYTSISTCAAALPAGCAGKDANSLVGTSTFAGGAPTFPAEAYKLASGSLGAGAGSLNGQAGGGATDMGAWGGTDVNTGQPIAQIGCNFVAGSTSGSIAAPSAPVLSVS